MIKVLQWLREIIGIQDYFTHSESERYMNAGQAFVDGMREGMGKAAKNSDFDGDGRVLDLSNEDDVKEFQHRLALAMPELTRIVDRLYEKGFIPPRLFYEDVNEDEETR